MEKEESDRLCQRLRDLAYPLVLSPNNDDHRCGNGLLAAVVEIERNWTEQERKEETE